MVLLYEVIRTFKQESVIEAIRLLVKAAGALAARRNEARK